MPDLIGGGQEDLAPGLGQWAVKVSPDPRSGQPCYDKVTGWSLKEGGQVLAEAGMRQGCPVDWEAHGDHAAQILNGRLGPHVHPTEAMAPRRLPRRGHTVLGQRLCLCLLREHCGPSELHVHHQSILLLRMEAVGCRRAQGLVSRASIRSPSGAGQVFCDEGTMTRGWGQISGGGPMGSWGGPMGF